MREEAISLQADGDGIADAEFHFAGVPFIAGDEEGKAFGESFVDKGEGRLAGSGGAAVLPEHQAGDQSFAVADVGDVFDDGSSENIWSVEQLRLKIERDVFGAKDDLDGLPFREEGSIGRGAQTDPSERDAAIGPASEEDVGGAEEGGDEFIPGMVIDLERGADLFDLAVIQDENSVGKFEGLLLIMGDEERGDLHFAEERANFASKVEAGDGIERAEGFVEEERPGFEGQGARQGHALSLPAGELRRIFCSMFAQADQTEHVIDGLLNESLRLVATLQTERDVLFDRLSRKESMFLKDDAQIAFLRGPGDGCLAIEMNLSAIGLFETGDDPQQGRFSAS